MICSKDELVGLRQFLQEIANDSGSHSAAVAATSGKRFLVVLDGKHTKLYKMLVKGQQPQELSLHVNLGSYV